MQFFDSFSSLGYSSINVILIFAVIMAIIFRSFGFHKRSTKIQLFALLGLVIVAAVPFVLSVNFLASENARLNEAIRDEGGLKRNFPKN